MNFSRKITVFAIFLFIPAHPLFSEVILHAFDWPYKEITKQAAEIKKSGCAAVLVAPALKTITTTEWWGRYQPVDYRVLDYPGTAVLADYQTRNSYFESQKLFGDLTKNLFSSADFRLPKRNIKMSLKNSSREILGSKATVSSANDSVKFAMPARCAGMWLDSTSTRVKDFKPKHQKIPVYEAIALHFDAKTNCLQISQRQSVHSRISISLYNPSDQCIFHAGAIPFNQGMATIGLNAVQPGICFAVANAGPSLAPLKFVR